MAELFNVTEVEDEEGYRLLMARRLALHNWKRSLPA